MMLSSTELTQKSRLRQVVAVGEVLALGIWVGTMIGFAFIFAPTAFHRIGNLAAFATLIGGIVRQIDALGALLGLTALALSLVWPRERRRALRQILIITMLAGTALEQYRILPAMDYALSKVGNQLATLDRLDPTRAAYDRLHQASSSVYGVVVLCGIAALALTVVNLWRVAENTGAAHASQRNIRIDE